MLPVSLCFPFVIASLVLSAVYFALSIYIGIYLYLYELIKPKGNSSV
jgi:hypothetical protein